MAIPLPASSKKLPWPRFAPDVNERRCSFHPKVLASETQSIHGVNGVKEQKVKCVRGYEEVLWLPLLLQHPGSAGWLEEEARRSTASEIGRG